MKGPYQRLLELCGLSQRAFAAYADISTTTLTYVLSGQLSQISDRLILSLGKLCWAKGIDAKRVLQEEYGFDTLQESYQHWRRNERLAVAERYAPEPREVWTDKVSPFATYISDRAGSRQRFCKDLKVNVRAVYQYEIGKSQSMPDELKTALIDIGAEPWLPKMLAWQHNWRLDHA